MRTLSRPMFRMGGPIKEGVMHGIREPRQGYKLGDTVRGRIGGVGQGVKNIFRAPPVKPISNLPVTYKPPVERRIAGGIWNAIRNLYGKLPQHGLFTKYGAIGRNFPVATAVGTTAGLPVAAAGLTHAVQKSLPKQLTGEGGLFETSPAAWGGMGAGAGIDPTVDEILREKTVTEGPYGEETKSILENIAMEKGPPGGGDPRMTYTDPDKASDLAKAARDKRVNELLEIMGYDKAKKGAAYDALIDASQIISQAPGGESLDISRDIIQPAIAATSKRFDKPKEIEEAVRLMQTKADIQKDLTKDETALANKAKRLQIKVHEKTLAGPSLTEAYNAYWEKHGSYPSGDSLANLARTKGVEVESVIDTKTVNSWLKNNKGKDEVDFMELEVKKAKEDKTPITPGVYVVTDRIIIVGVDGKVKSHL